MIPRQEFKDKLTKELLNIGHYNLHTSTCLSLFSKDIKVEQSFNYSGSLFHKLTSLNINEHCLYDCLIQGFYCFLNNVSHMSYIRAVVLDKWIFLLGK